MQIIYDTADIEELNHRSNVVCSECGVLSACYCRGTPDPLARQKIAEIERWERQESNGNGKANHDQQ